MLLILLRANSEYLGPQVTRGKRNAEVGGAKVLFFSFQIAQNCGRGRIFAVTT
jgi:hypothetical protein